MIVRKCVPSGMVSSVQIVGMDQMPKVVDNLTIQRPNYYEYLVFLTSQLDRHTISCIVHVWSKMFDKHDFLIKASCMDAENVRQKPKDQLLAKHIDTERSLSKLAHNRWVNQMINQGWRWGIKKSQSKKIHPLLKDWDLLPEKWQQKRLDITRNFLASHQNKL